MIYIYDILLNFTEEIPYEFFEWQLDDELEHAKKIPLYKVNRTTLKSFLYGDVQIMASFLQEIQNKTEVYRKGMIEHLPFVALFTDGCIALAIEFDATGKSMYKSRLLLDEEEEVLETAYSLKEISLSYHCTKMELPSFKTRLEKKMLHFLKQEFESALQEENVEKVKYFYEECFDEKWIGMKEASPKILKSLEHMNGAHKKLYTLLLNSYQLRK